MILRVAIWTTVLLTVLVSRADGVEVEEVEGATVDDCI